MARAQPANTEDRIETVRTYVRAKNALDLDEAMSTWHPDGSFRVVPLDLSVEGKEAVRSLFGRVLDAIGDYEGVLESIDGGEDIVTVEWRLTGRMTGSVLGFEPTDEPIDVPTISLFQLEDESITEEKMYFDLATLSSQADIDRSSLQPSIDGSDTGDPVAFVDRFAERWESPAPSEFAELFTEEGTLQHPSMEEPIPREEIPAYVDLITSVVPDISLGVDRWAARGDTVFVEWTIDGTFDGEEVSWTGADRFLLDGDRAVEGVAYFDTLPLWRLLGSDPTEGELLDFAIGEI